MAMLNESHMLLKVLRENKIELPSYHPRVKSPGQSFGKAVRVVLNPDGTVSSASEMTDEEMESLWTIREGNQNSFPVIRLAIPLTGLKDKDKDRQLMVRLRDIKAAELAALAGTSGDDQIELLIGFARAFMLASKDIDALLSSVCDKIAEAQKNGRFSADLAKKITTGPDEAALQFAFDMAANSIYRRDVRHSLESALPFEIGARPNSGVNGMRHCALSGKEDVLSSPFPTVPLPKQVLPKEFPIFSMFSQAKCNTRYGFQDHEIVPISRSETQDIAGALLWITADNRFGRTWRGIARGEYKKQGRKRSEKQDRKRSEKQDLLIVYVDGMPDISAENANLFGTDQDSIAKQFEADAGTVCNALKGVAKQRPESKLNLFVIRDVSQGQAQVVLSESFSVERFFKAVEQWQRAVKGDLPPIEVLLRPSQRGEKAIIASPPVPYPDEIVKILSRKYISLGLDARDVRGVSFGEVLDFMLRKEGKWEDACQKMLDLTLQDYEPLLVGLFGAKHSCDQERFQKYLPSSRKDALRAISLLGLLLDANNRSKESYMKDAAFKIGGFLALADILHKDYCVVVRDNSLPPSLIGNAMMPHAFANPRLAVEDLADRMRVYTGWAKTAREPEADRIDEAAEQRRIAVREARKTLARYEPLAKTLHDIGLPEECTGMMKAEILLGYLASTKGLETETN
jgi:hypothetical protein